MNKSLPLPPTMDSHRPFQIGGWWVEPEIGRLSKDSRSHKLEPKVMELLVYFARRPGRVLTREELEREIWAGTVVGYDALTNTIIKLRKAFGDDAHHPWLIETVSKKGYRLIAPVLDSDGGPTSPAIEPSPVGSRPRSRAVLGAIVVVVVLMAGGWFFDPFGMRNARIPTIAVLPFANPGGDPKLAYFSDGVREDIVTDLSKLSGLRVIARGPAFVAPDQSQGFKGLAEKIGARYVLEGSVRRSEDDIRVTARLIDTETGSHLWADGYNRRLSDIFAVQVDVTRNIVSALALTLTEAEKEYIARRDTRSVQAYDLFLQGQARYARNLRDENVVAREYFTRALSLDPDFTRAHGAMALAYTDDYRYGWSQYPGASADAALHHAERAVALDARSAQAHWISGFVQLHVRRDHAAALKMAERAVALDTNNASAHALLAIVHVYRGDTKTARGYVERAMQLDPDNTARYRAVLGFAHYISGDYAQARAALEQALERNPVLLQPQLFLAATMVRLGEADEARWLVDIVRVTHPEYRVETWADTQPIADRVQLRKIVDDLRRAGFS